MQINKLMSTALGKFVAVIILVAIVGGIILGCQYYSSTAKFIPITQIPPASEYNLTDAINQAAYERLQQAYIELDTFKGENLLKSPIIDPAISRANAFKDLGDTGRAILSYQWLNKYRPAGLQGFNNLANLYVSIGEYSKAEKNYLIAIKNSKGMHTDPYEGLLNLYSGYMRDKLPQIEGILLTAISQDPTQSRASYHIMLAQYYESVGRTGDAIVQYQEILKNDPQNTAIKDKIRELGGK